MASRSLWPRPIARGGGHLLTAMPVGESAKEAMRLGAYDCFEQEKPAEFCIVSTGLGGKRSYAMKTKNSAPGWSVILRVIDQSKDCSRVDGTPGPPTDAAVLIMGSRARQVSLTQSVHHTVSGRQVLRGRQLWCVAEPLLESAIFGTVGRLHRRRQRTKGPFEEATRGNFFRMKSGRANDLAVQIPQGFAEGEVRPLGSQQSTLQSAVAGQQPQTWGDS